MRIQVLILSAISFFFCYQEVSSQAFVYRAKNPAFGGESFNYQWMLSSAESQNPFTDGEELEEQSELEEFTNNLNSQLLGRINRLLLDTQFSIDGDLQPGVYTYGSLSVEIFESTEGLVVNILDTDTGEQTQVIVPN